MTSRDERRALEHFTDRYAAHPGAVADEVERAVLGAAWGGNGYTTVKEADELGRRLALGPGALLLDVGTGRGWPGLYLAGKAACDVVGVDLPVEGLRAAASRARAEGLAGRTLLATASAAALPFRRASFDGVVHTDVL